MTESMATVFLRYLGTSHALEDQLTGLRWERAGEPLEVSELDAQRLQQVSRFDVFEIVQSASAEAEKAEIAEKEAAEAPLKARVAEAAAAAEAAAEAEDPTPAEDNVPADAPVAPADKTGDNKKTKE